MFFRIAQKSTNVRAASVRKFVDSWPFKYSPIWSHCHHWPASLGITQGLRKSPKKKRQDDNLLMEKIAELFLTVNVDCPSFFKIVPFPASFFFFSFFLYFCLFSTVLIQLIENQICWWLDSNRGTVVSEVTALPTVPQPLPLNVSLSMD